MCNRTSSSSEAPPLLDASFMSLPPDHPSRATTKYCVAITAFAIGIICMIAGSIAVAAIHRQLPPGASHSLNSFSKMGKVNAWLLFGGGVVLTALALGSLIHVSRTHPCGPHEQPHDFD